MLSASPAPLRDDRSGSPFNPRSTQPRSLAFGTFAVTWLRSVLPMAGCRQLAPEGLALLPHHSPDGLVRKSRWKVNT